MKFSTAFFELGGPGVLGRMVERRIVEVGPGARIDLKSATGWELIVLGLTAEYIKGSFAVLGSDVGDEIAARIAQMELGLAPELQP